MPAKSYGYIQHFYWFIRKHLLFLLKADFLWGDRTVFPLFSENWIRDIYKRSASKKQKSTLFRLADSDLQTPAHILQFTGFSLQTPTAGISAISKADERIIGCILAQDVRWLKIMLNTAEITQCRTAVPGVYTKTSQNKYSGRSYSALSRSDSYIIVRLSFG